MTWNELSIYWRITIIAMLISSALMLAMNEMQYQKMAVDQSAVCAVLQKHIPNRSPQVVGGECGLFTGVDEPRVWMSVEDYGRTIMEDEK